MIQRFARFASMSKAYGSFATQKHVEKSHSGQQNSEVGGYTQLKYMTQYEKSFFYFHSKQRKLFSLYNFFSYLPVSIIKHIAKTASQPDTTIASDQIHLPKIVPNGVPVYQALNTASVLRTLRSLQLALIPMALFFSNLPVLMLTAVGLHWGIYYKSSFGTLLKGFVVKMELNPATQQILYQKIGVGGRITTHKVPLNDLEYAEKNSVGDQVFKLTSRSAIDRKLVFRIKTSGELLMFDRQGIWHEQGLNHQLMI